MPDNKVASQRGPAALSVGKDKKGFVFFMTVLISIMVGQHSIGEYLYHCGDFDVHDGDKEHDK